MDRWDPPASGGGTDVSGGSNDFLLMTGQPGLLGLSDGSISTLAPLFAAALSTGSSRVALLVGLSAAIGAAISMAVSEALSDDGKLTGRGNPWLHLRECLVCGHVGCCDSSKNKHATKHFLDTSHPIVASFEPGEDWRWCYVDETLV